MAQPQTVPPSAHAVPQEEKVFAQATYNCLALGRTMTDLIQIMRTELEKYRANKAAEKAALAKNRAAQAKDAATPTRLREGTTAANDQVGKGA